MHLQSVEYILLVLCHLWHPLMSQLTTSGQMYELVSGKDTDDNTSSFEKFIAYFECGQDDGCGYVAKEKSSGMFVKGTIGKAMNISKYSAMWKKRISGKHTINLILCQFMKISCKHLFSLFGCIRSMNYLVAYMWKYSLMNTDNFVK